MTHIKAEVEMNKFHTEGKTSSLKKNKNQKTTK